MRKLLSLIALFCAMAIGAGVSVSSANAAHAHQRGSIAQSRTDQCRLRRRTIVVVIIARLLSSPLLWRLLSPWLRLRWLWLSSPLLVALRSSHLPLVISQAEALGLSPGAFFMQRLTLGRRDEA